MQNKMWLSGFILLAQGLTATAFAVTPSTPKAQFAADNKKIAAAYGVDKKLCNDETSSKARLQCRRDAKSDNDKALAAARRQLHAPKPKPAVAAPAQAPSASATFVPAAVPAVVPAAAAAVPVAVPAAVAAPALIATPTLIARVVCADCGKVIAITTVEKAGDSGSLGAAAKTQTDRTVNVLYPDGSKANFEFQKDPGLKIGESVKNAGTSIVRE
jgi:hypothetical protein